MANSNPRRKKKSKSLFQTFKDSFTPMAEKAGASEKQRRRSKRRAPGMSSMRPNKLK